MDDYGAIREYVEKHLPRYKVTTKLTLFAVNLILFVVFTVITLAAASSAGVLATIGQDLANLQKTTDPIAVAVMLPLVGWFTALILHGVTLLMDTKMAERQMRAQLAMRAMGHKLSEATSQPAEKPKRDQAMRLSEDGELVPVDEEAESRAAGRS